MSQEPNSHELGVPIRISEVARVSDGQIRLVVKRPDAEQGIPVLVPVEDMEAVIYQVLGQARQSIGINRPSSVARMPPIYKPAQITAITPVERGHVGLRLQPALADEAAHFLVPVEGIEAALHQILIQARGSLGIEMAEVSTSSSDSGSTTEKVSLKASASTAAVTDE